MKKFKKLLVGAMALLMAFGTVACGGGGGTGGTGGDDTGVVSKNPYKLDVYSFSGGYGKDWWYDLAARYKKERAGDEIWVNGKLYDGVDFNFTGEKEVMTGLVNAGAKYDIWFQEQVYYNQYVKRGNIFHDMTDVLTSENPYEPGTTLESKLTTQQKEYYNRDGKYYGIPHYAGYVGIVYNKNMFDGLGFYFAKDYDKEWLDETSPNYNPSDCFIQTLDAPRSVGPDGVEGTNDDGLPTTYAEFYALCDIISSTNNPIAWAGKYRHEYLNWFMTGMTANNEGAEQMALNYSFNGTATNLVSVTEDADGNVTETKLDDLVLTPENAKTEGYKLAQQRGKYYALDFLETIVDNKWYKSTSFSNTDEQTAAQKAFVEGTDTFSERAAMLIEGCWWEMEIDASFRTLEQAGYQNPKDDFGWFPLPCIDDEAAEKRAAALSDDDPTTKGYTLTDTHNSLCFIGKQVSDDVYAIAKDFIQFAYTDESLARFSMITDTTKAVQYTMTDEQKAEMSAYGRSLMEMQENADIVCTFAKEKFYQDNELLLSEYKDSFSTKYEEVAVDTLKSGTSASAYFSGFLKYQKTKWEDYVI